MSTRRSQWTLLWPVAAAALVGLVSVAVSIGLELDSGVSPEPAWVALDLVVGMACLALACWRRRRPLAVALLVAAAVGFSTFALGAWLLVLGSLATHRRPRWILSALAVCLAGALAADLIVTGTLTEPALLVVAVLAVNGAAAATGLAVGARRAELEASRREAVLLRTEQRDTAERARLAERERIAGELHDELGHRLSVIALHSGALAYRPEMSQEQQHDSVEAIRTATREAMTDLRRTLGLLAETPGDDPSPAVEERIATLVAQVRAAGTPVNAVIDEKLLADLPSDISRHLYRIVQECLTNALRHAPGQPVRLTLNGTLGSQIMVRTSNPRPDQIPPSPGSGLGLAGVAERVRLLGGRLQIDSADGEFVVEAVLPWPA